MKFYSLAILLNILFIGFSVQAKPRLSYGVWVEDSLGIEFKYPRAWFKHVDRSPANMTAQFSKDDSIILRIDSQQRSENWDVDRFIEETMDQFIVKYPDMEVIQELRLDEGYQGFDEAHFLVAHYREGGELITNRFIFAKKNQEYFITQGKVIRKNYHRYRAEVDLFMKSLKWESVPHDRWRNDSLNYLSPSNYETTIQYIKNSLRPKRNHQKKFDSSLEYRPENLQRPTESDPRRPIKDMEPGKNPPPNGVQPVSDPNPTPI